MTSPSTSEPNSFSSPVLASEVAAETTEEQIPPEKVVDVEEKGEEEANMEKSMVVSDDPMDDDSVNNPATVFCIKLKQPRSNLLHKMSVPDLCRNFRYFSLFNFFEICIIFSSYLRNYEMGI